MRRWKLSSEGRGLCGTTSHFMSKTLSVVIHFKCPPAEVTAVLIIT